MQDFFDRAAIVSVLNGFNPWWGGKSAAVPEFRRLAFGTCHSLLQQDSLRRAILLSGPRRVGKTTLLQQLAVGCIAEGMNPKGILYLSLDHPLLKLLPLRKILLIYHETVHPETEKTILLLDEIQYSGEWETEVKLLIDHQPQYRILATGSASVVHKDKLAESGVGRWITVPIPTLSFYEFIRIRGETAPAVREDLKLSDLFLLPSTELHQLALQLRPLLLHFQQYLLVGGFPETARQSDSAMCQRLLREDVVERVLKRDMTALFGVRNINDLEKLFIYLCLHSGGILAHKTVAAVLETPTATVANHLVLLELANLVYRLPPTRLGGKKVLKARYKYYLVDAALRNAVLLRGEEVFLNPAEMGLIVETTVLRHLYAHYYRDTPALCYWREATTGLEVDIIVKSPAYHLPFEVKYKEKAGLDRKSGLAVYCGAEGVKRAFLVTRSDADFGVARLEGMETEFLKVPAHILCYLLGQAETILRK
jgi:predicted AAA+ superfamily ATPase